MDAQPVTMEGGGELEVPSQPVPKEEGGELEVPVGPVAAEADALPGVQGAANEPV